MIRTIDDESLATITNSITCLAHLVERLGLKFTFEGYFFIITDCLVELSAFKMPIAV
jgi:hypothetical protein